MLLGIMPEKYFSSVELVKKIEELFTLKKFVLIDEEQNL